MASEINIQASLTFQRLLPTLVAGAGAKDVDQTSSTKLGGSTIQTLTSTAETEVAKGGVPLASMGFLFIKNLDTTNKDITVLVATGGGPTYAPFAKLKPGQFTLIPVNAVVTTNNIYVKASAANVDLFVVAVEQ